MLSLNTAVYGCHAAGHHKLLIKQAPQIFRAEALPRIDYLVLRRVALIDDVLVRKVCALAVFVVGGGCHFTPNHHPAAWLPSHSWCSGIPAGGARAEAAVATGLETNIFRTAAAVSCQDKVPLPLPSSGQLTKISLNRIRPVAQPPLMQQPLPLHHHCHKTGRTQHFLKTTAFLFVTATTYLLHGDVGDKTKQYTNKLRIRFSFVHSKTFLARQGI